MMRHMTAYDLKSFYNNTKGQIIRSVIRQSILECWPETKSLRMVGYGYTLPYLKPYLEKSERVINVMPEQLGVHQWPEGQQNLVCLNTESRLPLETNSVDRMLMVHALEFLDSPEDTFAELYRVLKSTGRLLIVVPNRMGLWARHDWSPLGHGRPYSSGQVEQFLSDNLFVHERTKHALFSPPFQRPFFLKAVNFYEKIGPYLYPALGGVNIIEASKQIYAGRGTAYVTERQKAMKPITAKPVASRYDKL
jgi:SAM-dependent methyltransferase